MTKVSAFDDLPRERFAHLPTPLWRHDALDAISGGPLWVKRDDQNGGAAAGNKVRKLEYLLADARRSGADCVLTCGGAQSNHARATALCSAALGLECRLLLRSDDGHREPSVGNLFLDRLAGAQVRWITPSEYARREAHLANWAADLRAAGRRPYAIPEGGSNALGSMGYVRAMAEVRAQLDAEPTRLPERFKRVVVACGSAGTAAGLALGAARYRTAENVIAIAVCDGRAHFERRIRELCDEARRSGLCDLDPVPVRVEDDFIGPGYAQSSSEQRKFIKHVACTTGLVLDPVYSGKALFGLSRLGLGDSALFVHTGGLPGLLAQAETFSA